MPTFLTFLIPGLGHLIIGQPFKALFVFVLTLVGYFCFVLPGLVIHVAAMCDCHFHCQKQFQKNMASAIREGNRTN